MREAEALARWNARFAATDYVFGTKPNAFLAAQAPRLKRGMRALSIADGEGRNGVFLAQQGLEALSVDFSPVGLDKARRLAAQAGVALETECADLTVWDWGKERFDVVVAIFCQFAGPQTRPLIFRRIREALKPGGMVILQGYRPEQLAYGTGGPKQPDNLYTEAMLREAFAGFAFPHLAARDVVLDEGSGHRGRSAVIDLVAVKPR
jgi:cyclopropane fatty-acyl-phospholipid synthase-like methyltransferase